MDQATNTQQIIGQGDGIRAIQFVFDMKDGGTKRAFIDLLTTGPRRYAELESMALRGMADAGLAEDIQTMTHYLIK